MFEKLVSAGWWYMSLISALERFEANLVWVFLLFYVYGYFACYLLSWEAKEGRKSWPLMAEPSSRTDLFLFVIY